MVKYNIKIHLYHEYICYFGTYPILGSKDNDANSKETKSRFPIFTILVGFLHFDGNVGQQARYAMYMK